MGFLNSDIGYQIGLLAGGLWAERYREKEEDKKQAKNQHLNRDIFYRSVSLFKPTTAPNNTNLYDPNNTNLYAPYSPIRPYTFYSPLDQNR